MAETPITMDSSKAFRYMAPATAIGRRFSAERCLAAELMRSGGGARDHRGAHTPIPSFLLDFLIVTDIMMSVMVMMVAMYITKPVDFNVFPTTLLMLTLFRLALNVSSSRLILLNGQPVLRRRHVIQAFGNFVVGGNYIVGTVIFLVLIAIQYVVINHGAVRIPKSRRDLRWMRCRANRCRSIPI